MEVAEERDKELWFEDGNVVVVVEDRCYRLHKSILARHSVVFRDMFDLKPLDAAAIAAGEDRELEDCARVSLLHDSAEDFTYFLKAIYEPL